MRKRGPRSHNQVVLEASVNAGNLAPKFKLFTVSPAPPPTN